MKKLFTITLSLAFIMLSCKQAETNPFFVEWDTPFGSPPFHLIKEHHYLPAFHEGMRQEIEEIEAIVNNPEAPTFENTIVAFDQTGRLLQQVRLVFGNLNMTDTTPGMQEIDREITPLLTAHSDAIFFNQALFQRIKAVHEQRHELGLDQEEMRLVEVFFRDFARRGADLPEAKRAELMELNERIADIRLQLSQNMFADAQAFHMILDNEEDLVGLPASVIAQAAGLATRIGHDGKWAFGLARPSWTPFLQHSERRDLREKLFRGHTLRGNNNNEFDNKRLLAELSVLRRQMSEILGFENFAEFFISQQMAETPENVMNFLYTAWEHALARATRELTDLESLAGYTIEPWDWWFYTERIRQERYALNDDEIRPYFTLDNVRKGAFYVAERLWGITFHKRDDIPVYYEGVDVFEVREADGTTLALLFCDPHPRPTKSSGAWCWVFRSGTADVMPIVITVGNYTGPTDGKPAMLSWDDTTTFFHELGHALHNFFARGRFNRTSRSVPMDFVELPSQIFELWAAKPEVLRVYARHYETGEIIPDELIERMARAAHFNQGFNSVEYLLSAFIDMEWHMSPYITKDTDANVLEADVARRIGALSAITPRHRSTHFAHIFQFDYAAGYYVYWWAGQLDADAFNAFVESGDIFNQELATKFRRYILGGNNLWEGMELYKRFRGSAPEIYPFLRQRGLIE